MKKILIVSVLLTLVVCSGVFARSPRWNALGGEHRFIIDDTNYLTYPGRVTMFGNELFIVPVPKADTREFYEERYFVDNGVVSGALLNVGENMTFAFHYNLASAGTHNLRNALAGFAITDELDDAERDLRRADVGTPEWSQVKMDIARFTQNSRLAALDVRTFPDILWGMKMGNTSLGVRLALAKDKIADAGSMIEEEMLNESGDTALAMTTSIVEEIATDAMAFDLSVGATMYETPAGDLDLGVSFGIQSFSGDDPNNDILIESTGGTNVAFNARLNKVKKEGLTIVPLLSVNVGSLPSAEYNEVFAPNVAEVSYMGGNLGIGCREETEKGMVVFGLLGGYNSVKTTPTITVEKESGFEKKEILETADSSISATVLAGSEIPINKWLVARGGVSVKFSAINDEVVAQEGTEDFRPGNESSVKDVVGEIKSTAVDYDYDIGLRTIHGGLIVDVLLTRNILHRGPYFLTGASGNWGTQVCVTYKF